MKTPRFTAVATALAFAFFMPAMASAAVDQVEWDGAVAALQEVDPTISPPANDPTTVNAVGGGRLEATSSVAFGLGATLGPGGLNGQMTLTNLGQTLTAKVVCLAAAPLPTGGAIARIVGEIKPESMTIFPTLVFAVTDSGRPGGEGDAWSGNPSTVPASQLPCTPEGSAQPIEGSIVVNVP
jgi:hypothetical protein